MYYKLGLKKEVYQWICQNYRLVFKINAKKSIITSVPEFNQQEQDMNDEIQEQCALFDQM